MWKFIDNFSMKYKQSGFLEGGFQLSRFRKEELVLHSHQFWNGCGMATLKFASYSVSYYTPPKMLLLSIWDHVNQFLLWDVDLSGKVCIFLAMKLDSWGCLICLFACSLKSLGTLAIDICLVCFGLGFCFLFVCLLSRNFI